MYFSGSFFLYQQSNCNYCYPVIEILLILIITFLKFYGKGSLTWAIYSSRAEQNCGILSVESVETKFVYLLDRCLDR